MSQRFGQTTLERKIIELYYCIHCPYVGYEYVKEGKHEVCPKCGWVVYSDNEVRELFLNSNIYPILAQKYRKVHKKKEST